VRHAAHPKQHDVHWTSALDAARCITATVNVKWHIGEQATRETASDWKQPRKQKQKRKHRCPRRRRMTTQTSSKNRDENKAHFFYISLF
jgi:hypothetical protein